MRWDLDDAGRLAAIAEADLFAGVPEPSFDPYARIVARLLDVPVALVSIVSDDEQFFPAQVGVGEPWASRGGTPLSLSFCQHVVRGDAPLVVVDATGDDRVSGNLAVAELDVIAYLGVPVRAPGGEPLGSVCAVTHHPRSWTDDELRTLEEVADAVAQLISLRTSAHRWAEFAAEASHRLRTPAAALRLELDDLALWPSHDDEARAAIGAARSRAIELSTVVDGLSELARAQQRLGLVPVVVADLVQDVLHGAGVDSPVTGDAHRSITTAAPVLRYAVAQLVATLQDAGGSAVEVSVGGEDPVSVLVTASGTGRELDVPPGVRDRVISHLRGRVTVAPGRGFELLLPA